MSIIDWNEKPEWADSVGSMNGVDCVWFNSKTGEFTYFTRPYGRSPAGSNAFPIIVSIRCKEQKESTMNKRIELTAKVAKLDKEIADIKAVDMRKPNIIISGSVFEGDTAKLLIGCTINALCSQRQNYLEQLKTELQNWSHEV